MIFRSRSRLSDPPALSADPAIVSRLFHPIERQPPVGTGDRGAHHAEKKALCCYEGPWVERTLSVAESVCTLAISAELSERPPTTHAHTHRWREPLSLYWKLTTKDPLAPPSYVAWHPSAGRVPTADECEATPKNGRSDPPPPVTHHHKNNYNCRKQLKSLKRV